MKKYVVALLLAAGILTIFYLWYTPEVEKIEETTEEKVVSQEAELEDIEVVAENLRVPWEIVFLPDGGILITERTGALRRVGEKEQAFSVEGVMPIGEGGLLGLALHPNFKENRWVYLYFTARDGDESLFVNRVVRYRLEDNGLFEKTVIIGGIPGASNHDGGRIAFGPDGYLYVATGDAQLSSLAQDTSSLAGKILRVRDDGSIPEDNPLGNAVWSFGHRNPQGLAWDKDGQLWETEHGPTAQDEVNLIEKGANYGWPDSRGDKVAPGTKAAALHSGNLETWAPSGMAYYQGSLFFGGLKGQTLYEAVLDGDKIVELKKHFQGEFGRIRAVALGSDNFLYISTSNRDGRGSPGETDDKIIRINTDSLRL